MDLARLLKRFEKFTIDNSPSILAAFGATGTLTTAYLTGKATLRAAEVVKREQERINPSHRDDYDELVMTNQDVVKLVWKLYIPAAASATVTIAAIIGSSQISNRRATAMAAAFSALDQGFSEYKEKIVEKIGETKERAYRDEIAQDRVTKNPPNENVVIITDDGDVLCYDHFTGRYFKSSMEKLKQAENEINHTILHQDYASVSDFYDLIGLPATSYSEEVGWNHDRLLELVFSTVMSTDNRPCIAIDFDVLPYRKYSHFAGEG